MLHLRKIVILVCILVHVGEAQQNDVQRSRNLQAQALAAYEQKDYRLSLDYLLRSLALRPDHPTLMYNISELYALLHNDRLSMEWMGRVASMGMDYSPESDSSFGRFMNDKRFQAILSRFRSNRMPVNKAREALRLAEKGLITEGVSFDPIDRSWYVSSVRKRKIIRVTSHGEEQAFSTPDDSLWSVFGMKVDSARRILWACTAEIAQMEGYRKRPEGDRTGLVKYDLRSGKLIGRYLLEEDTGPHLFGDLTLLPSGDVIATDSRTPAVYVLARGSEKLEPFVQSELFVNLQGVDYSARDNSLYVADYSRGIFRIDVRTKRVHLMPALKGATLLGIDGLYVMGDDLIAIQNGVNPNRVIRLALAEDRERCTSLEVLEANHPLFDEPTLGVVITGDFYFIANSQWSKVDDSGNAAPDSDFSDAIVLEIRL